MKFRNLISRLRTSSQVFRADPGALMRVPRFLWRALREGPAVSAARLRELSDPSRFAPGYQSWLQEFHVPSQQESEAMEAWARDWLHAPRIAVLMPVFNPQPEWLQQAIDSVREQIYPHWQLCIADDCSTDPQIHQILEAAAASDPRIQVVFRNDNGHISACSNSALDLVDCPWMALLDHDDLLSVDALAWIARAIHDHPQARLFYSDEDKVGKNGENVDPYFKSDWDPLLMESQNMFCHLGVFDTELVRKLGGFRIGFEGAQDHDLVLRCSETVQRSQIVHIPRILYHWRVHPQSTASGSNAKPYSDDAGIKAVEGYLQRQGLPVQSVERVAAGMHPKFSLPIDGPCVSVIIPTRNGLNVLRPCLLSLIEQTDYANLEILVVDNGSDDSETLIFLQDLEQQGSIRVLRDPSPFNYSALNNSAVEQATGDWICLLNNDIEVINADWLSHLLFYAMRPGVGAVGARLLYPNRTIQHGGVLLGVGGVAGHAHHGLAEDAYGYFSRAQLVQEVSAVTAACLLVSKTNYQAVGGLDADNLSVAFNDVDFCLKLIEKGLHNVYAPSAVLLHHESVSRGYEDTPEKQARFSSEVAWMQQRWENYLTCDPAYNPNLALDGEPFRLAKQPRLQGWPVAQPMQS